MADSSHITISRNAAYSAHLADRLTHFKDEEDMVDFKICVEDEVIGCHRVIVSAHSPVLHRMIKSALKEGTEQQVTLKSIKASSMKLMMKYMYTGELSLQKNDLIDIVQACDFLQMLVFRDECLKYVPDILNNDNVISWMRLASLLDLPDIRTACKNLLSSSLSDIAKSSDFHALRLDEVKECIEELSKCQVSSDDLVTAAFRWTDSDRDGRIDKLEEILSAVSLQKCSPNLITVLIENFSPILEGTSSFYKLFTHSFAGKSKCSITQTVQNLSLLVIGGHGNKQAWKLDNNKQFQEIKKMPDDVFANQHSVCLYEDLGLIVTGGEKKTNCTLYSFASRKWSSMKNMKTVRRLHASVCIKGVLFVIGGCLPNNFSNSVMTLPVSQGADIDWTTGPDLPEVAYWLQAAALDTLIFVMGLEGKLFHHVAGHTSWDCRAKLFESPGMLFSMAANNGKVFVACGYKDICYIYSDYSDSWVKAKSPALHHEAGSLTYFDNKLMYLGGGTKDIQEYDIDTDSWEVTDYKLPTDTSYIHSFRVAIPE